MHSNKYTCPTTPEALKTYRNSRLTWEVECSLDIAVHVWKYRFCTLLKWARPTVCWHLNKRTCTGSVIRESKYIVHNKKYFMFAWLRPIRHEREQVNSFSYIQHTSTELQTILSVSSCTVYRFLDVFPLFILGLSILTLRLCVLYLYSFTNIKHICGH